MKYNRWTPENKQDQLSDIAKGESILLYGKLEDKKKRLQKHENLIGDMTTKVKNNMTLRHNKKHFLSHLLSLYDNKTR